MLNIPPEIWPTIESAVLEIALACYTTGIEDGATAFSRETVFDPPLAAIVSEVRHRYQERIGAELRAVLPGWLLDAQARLP